MKIDQQIAAQSIPAIKQKQKAMAGKTSQPAPSTPNDSVTLSKGAQKVMQQTSALTQQSSILAAAKHLMFSNPARATTQLQMIISEYPNSAEAQQARELLARITQ